MKCIESIILKYVIISFNYQQITCLSSSEELQTKTAYRKAKQNQNLEQSDLIPNVHLNDLNLEQQSAERKMLHEKDKFLC